MRHLMLVIAVGVMTGCAADVMMVNPRTGETAVCRESLQGLNPWSQKEACVGDYITQGWKKLESQ
jgi:uncharacterized protein YceK